MSAPTTAGKHAITCACLPDSVANTLLGECYCDCGADDWRLWEEVDGTCQVFPAAINPDALCFGHVKPHFSGTYEQACEWIRKQSWKQ